MDLESIELIKQLKARYFRGLDTGDLPLLKTVFTEDAKACFKGGHYDFTLAGWSELEEFYRTSFTPTRFGMHQAHHPEITVEGDRAEGIWYLHDIFINLEDNTRLTGSAFYTDIYRRSDGVWRIAETSYKRTFEEIEQRDDRMTILVKPIN